MSELIRINKYISETGMCSRREADKLIASGAVTVNGKKAEMGTKVAENDKVLINDRPLSRKNKRIYIAFNKPAGVTSTTDKKDKDNIIDFINYSERIFPIGRLDKMSEGLILLTNDGDIVNKILRAGNNHEKEYVVTVNRPVNDEFLKKMAGGVRILNTTTRKCKVEKISKFVFRIILTQGLNRQIRRMCETLDYEVIRLIRTRIMNISLKGIEPGTWRLLNQNEIENINILVKSSVKTEEASLI